MLLALAATLPACPATSWDASPPFDRFYWPTGIVHVASPVAPEGLLYVASANFDKRYEAGSIIAVNLNVAPPFGAPVGAGGPAQITELGTTRASMVEIASFAGEMDALDLGNAGVRLFVPSRSEGMKLHAIDARGIATGTTAPSLTCFTPEGRDERDCATNAPSLATRETEQSASGLPRAPSPYGIGVRPRRCTTTADCGADTCRAGYCERTPPGSGAERVGDVFVTHLSQADSPFLSATNYRGYLVSVDSAAKEVSADDFIDIGGGAGSSVAPGRRWVYVSGRYLNPSPNLVRLVDPGNAVYTTGLETSYRVAESRGLAVSSDESRIYLAGRQPDTLLVLTVSDPLSDFPSLAFARAVSLPEGPNEVKVIPRAGKSDLVVVTCSTAGVVVIYDDDVGDVVAQVSGVGLQPFGVAVALRDSVPSPNVSIPGARLFVTNFTDGRVAIIDIPELARPQGARLVAHLGAQQTCLTLGANEPSCDGGTP